MYLSLFFCLGTLAGWLGSLLAIQLGVKDIPNARSSHSKVTPRGGGIAFVVVGFGATLCLSYFMGPPSDVLTVLIFSVPVLTVAGVGLWDDISELSARSRLAAHFLSIAMMLALSWGAIEGSLPSLLLFAIACVAGVWVINSYNFMDGIDGLAAMQALIVLGLAAWAFHRDSEEFLSWLCLLLAAPVLGFLLTNLPPARIFMGDVGSGALGATFALLIILSMDRAPRAAVVISIALAPFLVDATLTLVRRLLARARPSEAHREHLYQKMTQRSSSHRTTLLWWGGMNLITTVPVSALVVLDKIQPWAGVLSVYGVLVLLHQWALKRVAPA